MSGDAGLDRERNDLTAPSVGRTDRQERAARSGRLNRLLIHLALIAGMIVMVYPLLWMVGAAFRPANQIFTAVGLFPAWDDFTLENFRNGWHPFANLTFGRFFRNSFLVAGLSVVGNLFACSLAAYAFARLRFPGKRWLFAIMLGTIMLPFHVTVIPQYILFLELGWVNTFLPLIVPKFFGTEAFFIFLMVQFIRTLPTELDQAASVDGCGHLQIFLRIILPLSMPALAVTAVFTFIWTYNDFFAPLLYLTSPDMFTVPLGLRSFLDTSGDSAFGSLFAMSVLSLGPVFGFFLASQRLLVQGIATTGLK